MSIKGILAGIMVLLALLFWILPRTRLAGHLKMTVELFVAVQITGIVLGAVGLLVSVVWPQRILEQHYFELILLPLAALYLYTALIGRVQGSEALYDEKQTLNMTQAAAVTWPASIGLVFLLYALYQEGVMTGPLFFPVFIFFSFTVYSASTLYFFKQN
jgi:hypothetical protein